VKFPHHLFRAYDIRGVAGRDLTAELVTRIGQALGMLARAGDGDGRDTGNGESRDTGDGEVAGDGESRARPEFVIARDGRASGPELAAALANGIRAAGCDVIDLGLAPTPVLYLTAARRGGHGVAVTASHNPAPDNGLKMMLAGAALFGDAIQNLKQRVIDGGDGDVPGDGGTGDLTHLDPLPAYRKKLAADIRLARPLKIVVDCGNGAAGVIAPQVFRDLNCEVMELFCAVDPTFPNHHPDPGRPENLRDLIAAVAQHKADVGLAFDGDGDRLGVVSGDGEIIWPDRLMLLFAAQVLRKTPGAQILFDVKCSQLLPRAIQAAGGVATMCKTGHSFIKDALRKTGAPLAGEMSGHIFFADRWGGFDDAIYAGARLCELLAADARAPAEVFAALPNTVNTPELRIDMTEGAQHELIAQLKTALAAGDGGRVGDGDVGDGDGNGDRAGDGDVSDGDDADEDDYRFSDGNITVIDGIRIDFADGFGLVRASNTSPAVIMRFEAGSQAQLKKIQSRFRSLFGSVQPDLKLPF